MLHPRRSFNSILEEFEHSATNDGHPAAGDKQLNPESGEKNSRRGAPRQVRT
jgi:hypothetical protein